MWWYSKPDRRGGYPASGSTQGIKIGKLGYIRQVSGAGAAITPCRLCGSVRRSWTLGRRRRRRSASTLPRSVLQGDKDGKGALLYASEAGNASETPKQTSTCIFIRQQQVSLAGVGSGPLGAGAQLQLLHVADHCCGIERLLQSTKQTPMNEAQDMGRTESFSLMARTVELFNIWSEKQVLAQRDALFVMFTFRSRRIINKNRWL